MSDRTLTMKWVIQGGDLDKAAKQVKQLAVETEKAGKEATKTKRAFEGMLKPGQGAGTPAGAGGFGRPGGMTGANIYGPAGSYSAFTGPRQWLALAASGAAHSGAGAGMNWGGAGLTQSNLFRVPGVGGAGGLGAAGGFAAGGLNSKWLGQYARFLGPAALVGGAFNLAGRGGDYINSTIANPEDRTFGGFGMDILEDLPIFGRGFGLMRDAYGRRGADKRISAFVGQQFRQADWLSQMQAGSVDARFQMADAQRQIGYGKAGLRPQQNFATFLKFHQNGKFVTENRLGISNEMSGPLDRELMAAEAGLDSARETERLAGIYAGDQRRSMNAANDAASEAINQRNLAMNRAAKAKYHLDNPVGTPGFFGNPQYREALAQNYEQAQSNLVAKIAQAEQAVTRAKQEQAQYGKILAEQDKARDEISKASEQVEQRRLDIRRNELAIGRQLESNLKSGAGQFADLMGGDRMNLIDSLRQLKQSGYQSLSPEQRALGLGNAITAEIFERGRLDSIKNDPELSKLISDAGFNKGIDEVTRANKTLAEDLATKEREINNTFKADLVRNLEQSAKDTSDIIVLALKAYKETLTTELTKKLLLDRLGQGQQP